MTKFESVDGILPSVTNQYLPMAELSELKQIIIRLQKILDEELENIRAFKNACVKDQTFEVAAPARDLEKKLLALRESFGS